MGQPFGRAYWLGAAADLEGDVAGRGLDNLSDGQLDGDTRPGDHRRFGGSGERSDARRAGERVAVAGLLIAYAVGLFDIDILMHRIVVDRVVVPDVAFELDVPYEHAVAGQIGVPALLLPVLKKEELVEVGGADDSGLVGANRGSVALTAPLISVGDIQPRE